MIARARLDRWLGVVAALTALATVLFAAVPAIDLWASGLFYDPARGFALASVPALEAARQALWTLSEASFAALLVALAAGLRPAWRLLPPREAAAGVLSFLIGPGLLVHVVLKDHWGRARPRDVEAFGGALVHSPPWAISDQCARNCSFVSGEASGAATMALVIALIALPRLPMAARPWAGAALALAALAGGLMRLAFGAHFLSDVVFAWALSAAATLLAWRLLASPPAREPPAREPPAPRTAGR